jgi:hypothetical protein|tara:strand:- start:2154 stop:2456 length:303 start_codon:yes stop_codon:yes gene_type:complete
MDVVSVKIEANHKKTRRLQLCVDKLETLEDIKKVLNVMKIRIDTDNPLYESVKDYFCLEIVPRGYFKLLEKIGQEGINNLHFHEIEQQALELLKEDDLEV